MGLANLYGRSAYQFGQSCLDPEQYVKKAQKLGYDSVGLADKDTVFALPRFYQACLECGLKPVGGVELKLVTATATKTVVLFIADETGYLNICQILALKKAEYYPEDLTNYTQGLLAVFPADSYDPARLEEPGEIAFFATVSDLFTHLWLGIALRTPEDQAQVETIHAFGQNHGYQTLAFPLVRYLGKKGEFILDILQANATHQALTPAQLQNQEQGGPDFLLSPKVMTSLYSATDLANAQALADLCSFNLFNKKRGSLLSVTGRESTDEQAFADQIEKALVAKGLKGNKAYEERVNYEKEVIVKMGFASYFLLVADYVGFAHHNHIKVGPGRGSVCGSLVAYLLDITQADPLIYDLSFERFLNPKRITMPDIDIDFEDERRNEIVTYLKNKYTPQRVAQITTFQTFKPKSALKATCLALGLPESRANNLTNLISTKTVSIAQALVKNREFKTLYADPYYRKAVDLAQCLEGLPVNTSIHAAGLVLASDDLYLQCPLSLGREGITTYEYPALEALGFLKFDLLALHYLTVIKQVEEKIIQAGKKIPDYQQVRDDFQTYQTINNLDLLLLFQLDASWGIKEAIRKIQPQGFNDLVALLALYRPGPMDNIERYAQNKQLGVIPTSGYPRLDAILKETFGIIIYQEQILKIAHEIAGFDLGEADLLRRAISKKDEQKLVSYRQAFIQGCQVNGMNQADAQGIYDIIVKFGNYGFNKSHSVAYALITLALAYLKTHFPQAFYSVALQEISPSAPTFKELHRELTQRNIVLLPPSVAYSRAEDYIDGDKAMLGLTRAKTIAAPLAALIPQVRGSHNFKGLGDFLIRVAAIAPLDGRNLKGLVDSGALDCFGYTRKALLAQADNLASFAGLALDEGQLPKLENQAESREEQAKNFVKELQANGVSFNISLGALAGISAQPSYRVGIVAEEPYKTAKGQLVSVADAYGFKRFYLPRAKQVKLYDVIVFQPLKPPALGQIWRAQDVRIIGTNEELRRG